MLFTVHNKTYYILDFVFQKSQEEQQMCLQLQHKQLKIPKVFRDHEFLSPPLWHTFTGSQRTLVMTST